MRYFLAAIIFSLTQCGPVYANEYPVQSYEVYDGDTLTHTDIKTFPNIHYRGSIRIRGIDTPEIRTRSACEKSLGYQAKDALKVFLKGKFVTVQNVANGKYAGRVLGDVFADGVPVADWILKHSHARVYLGGHRDHHWCGG